MVQRGQCRPKESHMKTRESHLGPKGTIGAFRSKGPLGPKRNKEGHTDLMKPKGFHRAPILGPTESYWVEQSSVFLKILKFYFASSSCFPS